MPAKKISEAGESTFSVIGNNIATAVAGPMPGSTPTAVPIVQPSSAHSRLIGVPAVRKPCSSWFQMSMGSPIGSCSYPTGAREPGQVDRKQLREHPEDRRGDRETDQEVGH